MRQRFHNQCLDFTKDSFFVWKIGPTSVCERHAGGPKTFMVAKSVWYMAATSVIWLGNNWHLGSLGLLKSPSSRGRETEKHTNTNSTNWKRSRMQAIHHRTHSRTLKRRFGVAITYITHWREAYILRLEINNVLLNDSPHDTW